MDNDNLHGIKIHLFRNPLGRYLGKKQSEEASFQYRVFGYYDWLMLESADLKDLPLSALFDDFGLKSPPLKNSRSGNGVSCYEKQFIRGYTCETGVSEFVEKGGTAQRPLLVVTELRIKPLPFADHEPNRSLADHYTKKLREVLVNYKELKEVDYRIYCSLGHGHFILLFRTGRYSNILIALNRLKEDGNSLRALGAKTESVYSIIAIDKNHIASWKPQDECEYAEVFLSLRPGIKAKDISETINGRVFRTAPLEAHARDYPVFGKYDARIKIDFSDKKPGVDLLSHLFGFAPGNAGIFSPDNALFRAQINYVRTRWYFTRTANENMLSVPRLENQPDARPLFNETFETELKPYITFFSEKLINAKSCEKGLFQCINRVNNYCWQIIHNELITEELADKFIRTLTLYYQNLLTCCLDEQRQVTVSILSDLTAEEIEKIKENLEARNQGEIENILLLSEMMEELVQSNRMVLETPIYNVGFIHSSLKLYEYYQRLVDSLQKSINESYRDPAYNKLNFFVTVNHSDEIYSKNFFPSTLLDTQLIPIELSWRYFVSPYESLPLLLHEIGHYCCPNIRERNQAFLQNVCEEYAFHIMQKLVIDQPISFIIKGLNEKGDKEFKAEYTDLRKKIETQIHEILCEKKGPSGSALADSAASMTDIVFNFDEPLFANFVDQVQSSVQRIFGIWDKAIEEKANAIAKIMESYDEKDHPDLNNIQKMIDMLFRNVQEDIETAQNTISHITLSIEKTDPEIYAELDHLLLEFKRIFEKNSKTFKERLGKIVSVILQETSQNEKGGRKSFIFKALAKEPDSDAGKTLRSNFAKRGLTENHPNNRKILIDALLDIFQHQLDFTIFAGNQDLFIETFADLLMVILLSFSGEQYARFAKENIADRRENRDRIAIIQNLLDPPTGQDESDKVFMEKNNKALRSYLLSTKEKIKNMSQMEPFKNIYTIYKRYQTTPSPDAACQNSNESKESAVRDFSLLRKYIEQF